LKIGNAFVADVDAYNKVTFSLDVQKLLVPTTLLMLKALEAYFFS
jgi:hypothetical protein